MRAEAIPALAVFEKKLRLEVPLFQRQYVWNQDEQWEPLWEDISRKFTEFLEGRRDAPIHFLGAMVLDQKQTPLTHVERRQVIDGQQRLTTLQIFLAALRDFCRSQHCDDLANECDSFILNKGMMVNPKVDKYKVWPTQVDRSQFQDVIDAGSRDALEALHPLTRRKYARKPEPRPRMVEAYLFFNSRLEAYFLGTQEEPAIAHSTPISDRLKECFLALRSALQVVVIDLEKDDDAQVIFETLNARGEPLLPADLLRNYIFLRAGRRNENQEELYESHWREFDEPFWRKEIRQGRLNRPRSDLFMRHFLSSRLATDIPIKHLFAEYKQWIEKSHPFSSVDQELRALAKSGMHFRLLIEPQEGSALYSLATFLLRFDISTAYPLLLALLEAGLSDSEWRKISTILESYLLRRAVCDLTTANYNRFFLTLTRIVQKETPSSELIRRHLAEGNYESTLWPSDEQFARAWHTCHAYQSLGRSKVLHILTRLNRTYFTRANESIAFREDPSIEHIMPQHWIEFWPLPDGTSGIPDEALGLPREDNDPRVVATIRRNELLHTLGNLTLVSQPLNASMSNDPWSLKRPNLIGASLLPINLQLHSLPTWDEEAIEKRAHELFSRAREIWPAP